MINSEDKKMRNFGNMRDQTIGHPDENDINNAITFTKKRLTKCALDAGDSVAFSSIFPWLAGQGRPLESTKDTRENRVQAADLPLETGAVRQNMP